MKKIFSKILISMTLVGIFMLPFSAGIRIENQKIIAKVEINKVEANHCPDNIPGQPPFIHNPNNPTGPCIQIFGPDLDGDGEVDNEGGGGADSVPDNYVPPDPNTEKTFDYSDPNYKSGAVTFGCDVDPRTWFTNCIVKLIYELIFGLMAGIASFSAGILDFFINYSTNNLAYGNTFITKAWGAVRDIANIFFIIALLYVAIKTILGLSGHDGKKLLTWIIIMALVINFSLFVTKIVIDASNILAKVFYNQIDAVDRNGNKVDVNSKDRSITVGLVAQFDPVQVMELPTNDNGDTVVGDSILGKFFFVLILSIILMGLMTYIFLSVGLLFVARVISLWLAMILSPIAFVSKTVDFDLGALGWNKWLSELFKNAFMAPIFIFFLYIIILFGDFMNIGASVTSEDTFIKGMNVFIPFMLVFVLLIKAKKLAVEYSGEMGAAVVKGGAVLGGLALGATALTTAAIGRNTVGAYMKGASTGDTAAQRYKDGKSKNIFDKAKGWATANTAWESRQKKIGDSLNKDQKRVEDYSHARHELDKTAAARYNGKKFNELSGTEREEVRKRLARDHESESLYGKTYNQLDDTAKRAVNALIGLDHATGALIAGGQMDTKTSHADHIIQESKGKQGAWSALRQSTRTGSFDVRNLSKVTANEGDRGFNKLISGTMGTLAGQFRSSLKQTMGFNYGEGQKELFKDLGHTISEALKGAQIKIDLSSVGKVEAEKHGGGGGHH